MRSPEPVEEVGTGVPDVDGGGSLTRLGGTLAGIGLSPVVPFVVALRA